MSHYSGQSGAVGFICEMKCSIRQGGALELGVEQDTGVYRDGQ